jgi:hypothetical protein
MDAKEERGVREGYPKFWGDIEQYVIPLLEAEADGETAGMIPHLRSA